MIIDHVGRGNRPICRPLEADRACETYQALKTCALVSKSWTLSSHKSLFKDIVFNVNERERTRDLVLPSKTSLRLVKSLVIDVAPQSRRRGSITSHLLKAFSACPLESLHIEGGSFSLRRRPTLRACFDTLSGRLSDLVFRFCLFEPEPLRDILAIQNTEANITFLACDQHHPDDPARNNIIWRPVNQGPSRTLCVTGVDDKPCDDFLIDLSRLSVLFSRLEVDFYEDGEWSDATQNLIDVSAGVVSFLMVNVISSTLPPWIGFPCHRLTLDLVQLPDDLEVFPPPDLGRCVDLSELVLNMKGSYSCIVETPGAVLATLLEANCPNLSRITVEVEDAQEWFLAESRRECGNSWKDLDSTLATFAKRTTSARGKDLVFIMEVTCTDDTSHRAKKWLPRFLPRFDKEGSLHVHDGDGDDCVVEDGVLCMGRAVLKEHEYESESDEKPEDNAAKRSGGKMGYQGDEGAWECKEDEKDGEAAHGNEGEEREEASWQGE